MTTEREEMEVIILNVFEEFEVADDMGRVNSEELFDESNVPESVSVAKDLLEDAGIRTKIRREHGDPAPQILAVARNLEANSIAMSGRKRSPTGRILLGSVTQSVLLSADRPVLVSMND